VLCIPTLIALSRIRAEEVDYARARNAAKRDHTIDLQRVGELAKNRSLLVFIGCMVLFQFFNTSVLPVAGQNLGHSGDGFSPLFMAGMLVVPQLAVAVLSPWVGYVSELRGRKILLLAGFAVAIVRALLFAVTGDPRFMLVVQILDGVTGAIITVLTILVITDLTRGSGRFNLAHGVFGTFTGIAAALGAGLFGFVAQRFGDVSAFLFMAAGIAAGMALLFLYLPETKPEKYGD